MKLNISYPQQAVSKKFLIEDEQKLKSLHDLRIADEVSGDALGDQFKGYTFKITGGSDKQGFAMIQGVMTAERVHLLLESGHKGFVFHPRQKRTDTRKRKSVRGCITSNETALLNLVIVKKGDKDIPGLTEEGAAKPNRLGPKRANKIRKLWNLSRNDDVRQYVIKRRVPVKEGSKRKKEKVITPKIQRLITPATISRRSKKERLSRVSKAKTAEQKAQYEELIKKKREATRSRRISKLSKKREDGAPTSNKAADKKKTATATPTTKPAAKAAPAQAQKAEKKAAAPAKAAPKAAAPAKTVTKAAKGGASKKK